jgi:hypothetical protein
MLKNTFTLIFILTLFFVSCKKKDSTPTPASSTTGSTTGLTPSTGGDYSDLQTTYMYTNTGGIVNKDSSVFASFYSAPVTSVSPAYVYAGTVTLNGSNIDYQGTFYYPIGQVPNIAGPLTWSISGSSTVTAFTCSFVPNYPKYTGGNLLPDTCVKASGITINISGVTNNLNSVNISIYCGGSNLSKYIIGSNGSVSFTPAEIANFPAHNSLTIIVTLSNLYSAIFNGKKQGFANTIQYTKYSYLK